MRRFIASVVVLISSILPYSLFGQTEGGFDGSTLLKCLADNNVSTNTSANTWIFLLSERECLNCNTIVINSLSDRIRRIAPNDNIALVIKGGSKATLRSLKNRIDIPLCACSEYGAITVQALPALIVVDPSGRGLYTSSAINQNPVDPAEIDAIITPSVGLSKVFRDGIMLAPLDSADAIGRIAGIVVNSSEGTFHCVDATANVIRRFDIATGRELNVVAMPDTLVYYFRPSKDDKPWRTITGLGYNPAAFGAIINGGNGDTIITVVNVMSGYHIGKQLSPKNHVDSVSAIEWSRTQIFAVWHHDSLIRVIAPGTHPNRTIVGLLRLSDTSIIGTCFWSEYIERHDRTALDSSSLFLITNTGFTSERPFLPLSQVLSGQATQSFEPTFIGLMAQIDSTRFAYINQLNQIFAIIDTRTQSKALIPLTGDTTLKSLFPRNQSGLNRRANPFAEIPYVISDINAGDGLIHILLMPRGSNRDARILHYSLAGKAAGETTIDSPTTITKGKFISCSRDGIAVLVFSEPSGWQLRWLVPGAR